MLTIVKVIACVYLSVVLAALVVNTHIRWRLGLSGIPYIQCFNPVKLVSVLVGYVLMAAVPAHVFEQYVLRFYDPDCRRDCYLGNSGKCVECGCVTAAKMWSPLERDSRDRWGAVIWSRREYEELRREYPVDIVIKYRKKEDGNKVI